jgi:hypothetical protein
VHLLGSSSAFRRVRGILLARSWAYDCAPVEMPREGIASFCARNHIRKLSLFGSVLTPRFADAGGTELLLSG